MKENFLTFENGFEQFSIETSKDLDEFKNGVKPYYVELLKKGYSFSQIENLIIQSMISLRVELIFKENLDEQNNKEIEKL